MCRGSACGFIPQIFQTYFGPDVRQQQIYNYSPERVPRQLGFRRFLGTWRISARKKCARLSKVVCRWWTRAFFRSWFCNTREMPIIKIDRAITMESRCKIEFWPHWISTRGVLIQRAAIKIQRIFHVELRPPETGGHCITTPPTDKILTPPLNCDPT